MYIVTTCLRPTDAVREQATRHASHYGVRFVERKKQSLETLMNHYEKSVLVFDKRRVEYTSLGTTEPFFFHPSSSVFRIKQLMRDGHDPLVDTAMLEPGDRVLDCTLGLGSDSIVMSHAIGADGRITGIESEFMTAMLVKEGLSVWVEKEEAINQAMRRIEVVHADALTYLKTCIDDSFDIVYFDPMFEKTISESVHLNPLRSLANTAPLSDELIREARRVAKKRIVLKAHFESEWFNEYGFTRITRKTSKLHYGYIDIETDIL
ncbi:MULTISPECIES: class I SAM-dependent methyltransferase [Exiguobacterium]|uniref:class I SAM-dependent methyltransferase n=1 Tax=Exiguobacterium TaxID=33986 RepID=UPI001BEA216F|nr:MULTISPECIES: class I SAM-dependent methyltransferase [Exiguobacterium]MCT4782236.1 class I SAM-dependent methyltransferase [Exiguobacterium himgiriensis]